MLHSRYDSFFFFFMTLLSTLPDKKRFLQLHKASAEHQTMNSIWIDICLVKRRNVIKWKKCSSGLTSRLIRWFGSKPLCVGTFFFAFAFTLDFTYRVVFIYIWYVYSQFTHTHTYTEIEQCFKMEMWSSQVIRMWKFIFIDFQTLHHVHIFPSNFADFYTFFNNFVSLSYSFFCMWCGRSYPISEWS